MTSEQIKAAVTSIERAPFSAGMGLRIESAKDGESTVRMPFSNRLLNDGGDGAPIHGGAIAALADVAACAAVWTLDETRRSATLSMTVNYSGFAARTDLVAVAKVRRHGKSIASVAIEIRSSAGDLVADALVTYKIA
jgi:uncharacterized protein (TIGR00369 family)